MPDSSKCEEVGDLFVTATELTLKLLPSRKMGTRRIRWFAGGTVTDVRGAARDIAALVGRVRGRSRVVRSLTVMTPGGRDGTDLDRSRLRQAIEKAGFQVIGG